MAEIASTGEAVAVDFEECDREHALSPALFAVATTTGLTGVTRVLMHRREAEELMTQMVFILGYKLDLRS